jgi:acyl carrier protein
MTEDQILERITDVVRDELDDDEVVLTPDTKARDVEGWDSLAHVRIMVAVEQAFGVHFDMADITSLDSVGDLVALVGKSAA